VSETEVSSYNSSNLTVKSFTAVSLPLAFRAGSGLLSTPCLSPDSHMTTNDQPDLDKQLSSVLSSYDGDCSELIPILQGVQASVGYIPEAAIAAVARFLNLAESTVYGVVTFYSQFHLTRQGRHKIRVCQGTACHVRGGRSLLRTVRKRLGIKPGETTEDYAFTLDRVACFGSCALSPVMVVDDEVHGRMTASKAEHLLKELK